MAIRLEEKPVFEPNRCLVCGSLGEVEEVIYPKDHPGYVKSSAQCWSEKHFKVCGHRLGRWTKMVLREDEWEYPMGYPPALPKELTRERIPSR